MLKMLSKLLKKKGEDAMSEKGDVSDLVGFSGEDQLETIQELLDIELEVLMEEFRRNIKTISKNFYDYDLTDYAEEYVKDSL